MRLYERSRSLSLALGLLELKAGEETVSMGTDGWALYVNGAWLREAFLADSEALCRLFLHVLCHCMLGHPFRYREEAKRDGKRLGKTELLRAWEAEAWELLEEIAGKDGWQEERALGAAGPGEPRKILRDDHSLWDRSPAFYEKRISGSGPGSGAASGAEEGREKGKRISTSLEERETIALRQSRKWEQAFQALRRESGSKRAGSRQMSVVRSLTLTEERRYDYRTLLKGFASLREESGLDMEQSRRLEKQILEAQ